MAANQSWRKRNYLKVFNLIASERIKRQDANPRKIHTHLLTILATIPLMWSFVFISYFHVSEPLVWKLMFMTSMIHLLSPALFLFSSNVLYVAGVSLFSAVVQETVFVAFTGGFDSVAITWFALIPLYAGLLGGRKTVFIWSLVSMLLVGFFMKASAMEYAFPKLIGPEGVFLAQAVINFGIICLAATVITLFLRIREENEAKLKHKNDKINHLLRTLTHDVSNSLTVLNAASTLFQLANKDQEKARICSQKMNMATGGINDVISNVRTLHSAENDWETITARPHLLENSIKSCVDLLSDKLTQKNIDIRFCKDHVKDVQVMVDPVFFNHHVLMNALTNAIKFSEPNSKIDVCALRAKSGVYLKIRDYGVGMNAKTVASLFKEQSVDSTPGTAGEPGSGFGTLIMRSFMEKFGGQILVDSKTKEHKDHGTTLTLKLKEAGSIDDFQANDFGFGHLVMKSVKAKKSDYIARAKKHGGNELSNNLS